MYEPPPNAPIVRLTDLTFGWTAGKPVLSIPDFEVGRGEKIFIHGPSGSGKSTLLGIIGGVLIPQSGRVSVLDKPLAEMSAAKRDVFRADHVGYIFQMFNLLPYLSLAENVVLPCRFSTGRADRAITASGDVETEARRLLAHLGLEDEAVLTRPVTQLSMGQQQRVAAARALIGRPELVIADEPTSSLDTDVRASFLELLVRECEAAGSTIIFVSHDRSLAEVFDRSVSLSEINQADRPERANV